MKLHQVTLDPKSAIALTLVFVVLKLTNVIHWPWIWVTAPGWGFAALIVVIYIILVALVQRPAYRKVYA